MGVIDKLKQKVTKVEPKIKEKVKPAPYDFTEYSNFEDMIGWIGFITPKGTFYRVRPIGSADGGHGEWAFGFLYNLGKKASSFNLNANTIELVNNPEFSFTMIIEDRDNGLSFVPGINGLTKEQIGVINTLNHNKDLDDVVYHRH